MPPNALIDSARNGDAAAITTLLAAAQPDIRRYARSTCQTADVDDAVQDALCLVHRHIGRLRVISAFSGWLFAVVRHECARLARRDFGRSAPLEAIENHIEFATRPDHELRLDLASAIEALPAHYREVLVLRDLEELTIDEIGTRLHATRETVKARLHRARTLAREYLTR